MNYYETLYIINSSLEGEEIKQVKKEIEEFITSEGGDIYSKSDWGRTRLAYEIEKQRYGNFILLKFAGKPELVKMLKEKFGLMEAVLSHLCVRLDEEPERVKDEIKANEEKDKEPQANKERQAEKV